MQANFGNTHYNASQIYNKLNSIGGNVGKVFKNLSQEERATVSKSLEILKNPDFSMENLDPVKAQALLTKLESRDIHKDNNNIGRRVANYIGSSSFARAFGSKTIESATLINQFANAQKAVDRSQNLNLLKNINNMPFVKAIREPTRFDPTKQFEKNGIKVSFETTSNISRIKVIEVTIEKNGQKKNYTLDDINGKIFVENGKAKWSPEDEKLFEEANNAYITDQQKPELNILRQISDKQKQLGSLKNRDLKNHSKYNLNTKSNDQLRELSKGLMVSPLYRDIDSNLKDFKFNFKGNSYSVNLHTFNRSHGGDSAMKIEIIKTDENNQRISLNRGRGFICEPDLQRIYRAGFQDPTPLTNEDRELFSALHREFVTREKQNISNQINRIESEIANLQKQLPPRLG